MNLLFIYLLGVIISIVIGYNLTKRLYSEVTLNDILGATFIGLFSWGGAIATLIYWVYCNGDEIILWKKK
jgi:hypothetical protein